MLTVNKVTHRFKGVEALTDVTFTASAKSVTSIIGPNGAGKTTVFNIISGLLSPATGCVSFDEANITGWAPHRIAALGIARTFQNIQLFPTLNAIENVMAARYCRARSGLIKTVLCFPSEHRERRRTRDAAEELLSFAGISHCRYRMPRELPYGDQRRLEIARALASDPQLLLLDEPAAGMIASEVERLAVMLESLVRLGKTIVLIDHNLRLVLRVSQSIIVLNFGHKIAEGLPAEIVNDPSVRAAYLGT